MTKYFGVRIVLTCLQNLELNLTEMVFVTLALGPKKKNFRLGKENRDFKYCFEKK